ncbi:MAG: hypothetical protein E5X10_23160 [Mesorhizobium sp.]|nr:MAG: hypothetical protein E5X10_23160 [Mesorhizobium sp.]
MKVDHLLPQLDQRRDLLDVALDQRALDGGITGIGLDGDAFHHLVEQRLGILEGDLGDRADADDGNSLHAH